MCKDGEQLSVRREGGWVGAGLGEWMGVWARGGSCVVMVVVAPVGAFATHHPHHPPALERYPPLTGMSTISIVHATMRWVRHTLVMFGRMGGRKNGRMVVVGGGVAATQPSPNIAVRTNAHHPPLSGGRVW